MLFHVWVCWVHMCVPVHMCSGVDGHLCTYMHRSEVNARCLPQSPAPISLRQHLSLTVELIDCLDWLPSRLWGSFRGHRPRIGALVCPTVGVLYWTLEDVLVWTQLYVSHSGPCACTEVLYQQCQLPSLII